MSPAQICELYALNDSASSTCPGVYVLGSLAHNSERVAVVSQQIRAINLVVSFGFGAEARMRDTEASVYWHDDTLERERVEPRETRYLISGTGDGGLTDLLRIRLKEFRHHHLRDSLFHLDSARGQDWWKRSVLSRSSWGGTRTMIHPRLSGSGWTDPVWQSVRPTSPPHQSGVDE